MKNSNVILPPTPLMAADAIARRVTQQGGRGAASTERRYIARQVRLCHMTLPSGYGRTVSVIGGAL